MSYDPFLGTIQAFPYNFAPKGWAECNGQLLPIAQNTALFSLLSTTYGGDGKVNFALPDLRGRIPMHPNSKYTLGQRTGGAMHTLIAAEMPTHSHTLQGTNIPADETSPNSQLLPAATNAYATSGTQTAMALSSVGMTGGNQPHNNIQPCLALTFCIATQGIYPPRS